MTLDEKIKYRETEIQRAWDNAVDEVFHLERFVEMKKEEFQQAQTDLAKAENMKFQIYKKAQKLGCTDIL